MGFVLKRYDYEEDIDGFLTDDDEFGVLEEAKVFDDYGDAVEASNDPPWDDTGDYDYSIEEI